MNDITSNFENQSQTPDQDGLIMIRRSIPSDNSCLFNAISLCIEGSQKPDLLRRKIVERIRRDSTYSEAILGKPVEEYCSWIMNPEKWGGEIELVILADFYKTEISVVSVESLVSKDYGLGAQNRIYLLYDGIHYDPMTRNFAEEAPRETDITQFDPSDQFASQGALFSAYETQKARSFTNTSTFALLCGECNTGFKGQEEAVAHSKETGHTNFQQV